MSRKYKTPRFLIILILTSITAFFWVAFEIYYALTSEPDIDVPAAILRPLNPELDLETLGKIDDTIYLSEQEIGVTNFSQPEAPAEQAGDEEFIEVEEATGEAQVVNEN